MTRRTASKLSIFILLCVPLLASLVLLVQTVTPLKSIGVLIHPISLAIFFIVGLYAMAIVRQHQGWTTWWYWIAVISTLGVGIWQILLHVRILSLSIRSGGWMLSTGDTLTIAVLGLSLLCWPRFIRFAQFLQVIIAAVSIYAIGIALLHITFGITAISGIGLLPAVLNIVVSYFMLRCVGSWSTGTNSTLSRLALPVVLVLVCIGTLFVTGVLWQMHKKRVIQEATYSFDQRSREVSLDLETRMHLYTQVLHGVQGLFAANSTVSESQWRSYVRTLDIPHNYAGISRISYARHETLTDSKQQNVSEDSYYALTYVSSFTEGDESTIGFNISSDVQRGATITSAVDQNAVIATPVLMSADGTPVVSLYAPLYNPSLPVESIEERRAASVGVVVISLRSDMLFPGIAGFGGDDAFAMTVQDGAEVLYRSGAPISGLKKTVSLPVGGRVWVLNMSVPVHIPLLTVALFGTAGIVGAVLVTFLVSLLVQSRRRRRIMVGTFAIKPVKTDGVKLFEDIAHDYAALFKQKKQSFTFVCTKRVPALLVDPIAVRIIVQHILTNAHMYTPEKGTIELVLKLVGTKKTGGSVVCICTDTGYGIPEDQMDEVFGKFFQASHSDPGVIHGAGLGLYTSKQLATAMHCDLSITSEEHVGTSVIFTMPLY